MREFRRCVMCNKLFIATRVNAKCCGSEECKKLHQKMIDIEKRRKANALKQSKKKKQQSIVDIAVAARQAGMTYGQYVAKMGL